jgi:V8-like Glu-specific endopeptidase
LVHFQSRVRITLLSDTNQGMGTSISSSFESKAVKEPYLTVSSKVGVPPTKVFDLERHLRLAMVSNESGMFSKISPSEEERKDKMILHAREEDLKELVTEDSVPVNLNEREVKYPFSAVGIVLSIRKNRTIIGTGSLIGPNLVLTCAHNCFDATKRAMDQEVRFIPSEIEGRLRREQLSNENVGFKARYVYVPQQYKGMDL